MANKYMKRVLSTFLLGSSLGLFVASGVVGYVQPNLSKVRLEEILNDEKRNLGLDGVNIDLIFGEAPMGLASATKTEDGYKITLERLKNKFALKHEIYHIAKDHFSQPQTLLGQIKKEYSANIYSLTGLKF